MPNLVIYKVNNLPETLNPDSLYVIRKSEYHKAELVFTSSSGEVLPVIDTEAVQTLIADAVSKTSSINMFDNIEERNAAQFMGDASVYVVDASDDPQVGDGPALYFYKKSTNEFTLILCAKHTSWGEILNGPQSTPAQIDAAVQNAHVHENTEIINELGDDGNGQLTYKGALISGFVLVNPEW